MRGICKAKTSFVFRNGAEKQAYVLKTVYEEISGNKDDMKNYAGLGDYYPPE